MASIYKEPTVKAGLPEEMRNYLMGDVPPAAPSIIHTSSKYLNDPYFRDTYAQMALRRRGTDIAGTYCIPMAQKAVADVTDWREYASLIDQEKENNPEFAEWLEARTFTVFTKENMAGYEEGTLGYTIWDFLVSTGYDSSALSPTTRSSDMTDIDYIALRQGSLHDLEHMITGFGTNSAGEGALVWSDVTSFTQYFSPKLAHYLYAPLTFLTIAGLQAQSLHRPEIFPTAMDAMRRGIAMGQALQRPLLLEPWEKMFDWTIDDIREKLGIVPGPGSAWNWTSNLNEE